MRVPSGEGMESRGKVCMCVCNGVEGRGSSVLHSICGWDL